MLPHEEPVRQNRVVTTLSVLDSPIVSEDPILSVFKEQMNNSVPTPNFPKMTSTWEPLAQYVRRVHRGSMKGTQALEEAWREFKSTPSQAPPAANPTPYIIVALLGLLTALTLGIKQAKSTGVESPAISMRTCTSRLLQLR